MMRRYVMTDDQELTQHMEQLVQHVEMLAASAAFLSLKQHEERRDDFVSRHFLEQAQHEYTQKLVLCESKLHQFHTQVNALPEQQRRQWHDHAQKVRHRLDQFQKRKI